MPKLFCVSDIHSFYDEFREALNSAGFDENNPNHWLICCGDYFDRGPSPVKVMNYLMSLPRKVLIFGNHELLFNECCNRKYWCLHDVSNGTMDTICELGGAGEGRSFDECCIIAQQRVKPFFDSMVNYFETKNYVFVHGFIPINCEDGLPYHYQKNRRFSKKEDWRYAHQSEWEQAMWLNGMQMAMDGFEIEKCIVVGHYHTSYGHALQDRTFDEWGEEADFSPFYYENKLIAIDSCCAHTHKINILKIEDDFINDKSM